MFASRVLSRAPLLVLTLSLLPAAHAADLRGSAVVAADGTYLGSCSGMSDPSSVANPYGPYGNAYRQESLFNPYGPYGNPYGPYSAANALTMNAPYLLPPAHPLLRTVSQPGYNENPRAKARVAEGLAGGSLQRVSANIRLPKAVSPQDLRETCQ